MHKNKQFKAILLLGATGSGKTPLGDLIEKEGINNQRCFHFDFGVNLRSVAEENTKTTERQLPGRKTDKEGMSRTRLTDEEVDVIRESLSSGKLLENEQFVIADKILQKFIEKKNLKPDDLIIMNGLPRHVSQAKDVDAIIDITRVIYLSCTTEVTKERIRKNTGGDRTGRNDDSLKEINRKIETFINRTIPILDHYHEKKVETFEYEIEINTQAEDVLSKIILTENVLRKNISN